ncbi:hypothetical protein [Saccharothrix variisporea]|uniref:Uncharacterized protein n=1 Tax=Saccharothrix variisporea TaxID=543527 RepID=A0A495X710_9PSEU|nr:hypothetical protein [Saccharothrix variisporea]RKT69697.1 hypothetical protein DFJ66_2935 [Saccharothrix variisporea]
MRRFAVALAALALAGCTSGTPAGAPGGSSTTQPTTTGSSVPLTTLSSPTTVPQPPPQPSAEPLPGGPTAVPAERIDASTLSDLYKKDVQASADGRTLRVLGLAGGCKRASAEVAAQAADQVRITLVTTYYPPNDGVCTQELYDVPLNVTLDAPLGDRRVVLESREDTA